MKFVYVWEPTSQEKRVEFLQWMIDLNLCYATRTVRKEVIHRLALGSNGRLALWVNTYYYPYCCGITILAQPGWGFEFNRENAYCWPRQHVSEQLMNGGANPRDMDMDVVHCGNYSDLNEMRASISKQLSDQIGNQGCYMMSDYADGRGVLWGFVDQMMDRRKFSVESVARFQNGNTGRMLGTWIARALPRANGRLLNTPYLDPTLNKSFSHPSVSEAILGLKEYV